jgi:RHS repeat-associated protein
MLSAVSRTPRTALLGRFSRKNSSFASRVVLACVMLAGSSRAALAQTDAGAIKNEMLTINRASGASGGQGVLLQPSQRASAIGFGGGEVEGEPAGVDLYLLTPRVSAVDLAFPTDGFAVTIGRSYNGAQTSNSSGYQGNNWFQSSRPELVRGTTDATNDTLYMVIGADRMMEFIRVGSSSTVFAGVNGTLAIIKATPDATSNPGIIEVFDLAGNVWTFFDFDGDAAGYQNAPGAQGQLWKVTSADGTGPTAYAGTSNTISAGLAAFEQENSKPTPRLTKFVDGSDRMFEYAYTASAVGGQKRLASVTAWTKTGGSWASPTSPVEVGRVEYQYYGGPGAPTSPVDPYGNDGDLRLVTTTTPLSGTGVSIVKTTYMRYTTTAPVSLLKMVLGPEGYRLRAKDRPSVLIQNEVDNDIRVYSSHEYAYGSGTRVLNSARVNAGGCGSCGGSPATSAHALETSTNGSFSGTSGYDGTGDWGTTKWHKRTIITRPDSSKIALYFDETGQQLGRVHSSSSTFASNNWATKIERDASGRVLKHFSTAAVSGYNHSTGAITTGSTGLTHLRSWSTDSKLPYATTTGWVGDTPGATWTAGATLSLSTWSGSTKLSETVHVAQSITKTDGTNIARLSVTTPSSSSSYPDGSADTTTYTRDFWTGSSAWAPKKTTVTAPSISHSYSPSTVASESYSNTRRQVEFTKDPVGKWTFTQYNGYGQIVRRVDDATTADAEAPDYALNYGITLPSTGFNLVTLYSYDAQGRVSEVTAPDGRVSKTYYTKLSDGRPVVVSVGSVSGSTHSGPVSYTVSNLAGQTVASGIISLTNGSTTTAMTAWINSGSSDIVAAVQTNDTGFTSVGTLSSLSVNVFDSSGVRRTESQSFFSIPTSYSTASSTTNYDTTTYTYDTSGRTVTVTDPTATITKTIYDSIGRPVTTQIGVGSNLYDVQTVVYDGGGVGNGLVTSRTVKVDSNSANDRTSSTLYDYRGRAVVQLNPIAPHSVTKYDHMGRSIATAMYSSSSGLTASTDPTATTSSGRVALSETLYDDRGRAYGQKRHEISQSNGNKGDHLLTHTWVDAAGRTIKSNGGTLTKTTYDLLGRPTHRFILAKDNDASYADAATVTGDYVLEEHQSLYNATDGTMEMSVAILRHPKDTTTTGALDAVGDAINVVNVPSANMKGRVSITSMYYDTLDRPIATVQLGNNVDAYGALQTYTRSSDTSVGTRGDRRLISETYYLADGRVDYVADPKNIKTKTTYDAMGQTLSTISNYVDGTPGGGTNNDQDNTIAYTYSRGRLATYTADLAGTTNDQTTTYTYGVSTGDIPASKLHSNRLLRLTTLPEGTLSYAAYNRLGQTITTKDNAGNVIDMEFDALGREKAKIATNVASKYDASIRRIATTYLTRGLVDTVTQYDATSGGSAKDQVDYDYDGWGNLTLMEQDFDSAKGGTNLHSVSWEYAKAAPTGGAVTIRKTSQSSPWLTGSRKLSYDYDNSGSLSDTMSRVWKISSNSTGLATYEYLGASRLVGTDLSAAAVSQSLFAYSSGSHSYNQLDQFGRIEDFDWYRANAEPNGRHHAIAANTVVYDRASNIVRVTEEVHDKWHAGSSSYRGLYDVAYVNDDLGRLLSADSGHWDGTAIVTASRKEVWALSPTGNWSEDKLDLNGDGDYLDANERDTTQASLANAFDKENRYVSRNGKTHAPSSMYYDGNHQMYAIGNGTEFVSAEHGYVYDAFGRMTEYRKDVNDAATAIVKYQYNGLNQRIGWQYDVDSSATLSTSEQFYFVFDDRWRIVATVRAGDANPKEAFAYHAAGFAGSGGSSYIDSAIMREKDANTGWTAASDGTLEERVYYVQNWRSDVVAILDAAGNPLEEIRYSAYGSPSVHPIADVNHDGLVNSTDQTVWGDLYNEIPSTGVYAHNNLNRDELFPSDLDDDSFFNARYTATSGGQYGFRKLSSLGNRKGCAGYEWDVSATVWHVRHRVLDSESGKWTRMDPLGYVDGASVYEYVASEPLAHLDPWGLASWSCMRKTLQMSVLCTGCLVAIAACIGAPGPHCVGGLLLCCSCIAAIIDLHYSCGQGSTSPSAGWICELAGWIELVCGTVGLTGFVRGSCKLLEVPAKLVGLSESPSTARATTKVDTQSTRTSLIEFGIRRAYVSYENFLVMQ